MKTAADLRAYCESRFPVGKPTDHARSVTGEPYAVIGYEKADDLGISGVVREGYERADYCLTPEEALWSVYASFCAYAEDKRGTLYWRVPPRIEKRQEPAAGRGVKQGRYRVYMRCLISDKPVVAKVA